MYCECPAGPEKFGGKPRRARKNWGKAPQGQNYRDFHRNHMGTYGNDILEWGGGASRRSTAIARPCARSGLAAAFCPLSATRAHF